MRIRHLFRYFVILTATLALALPGRSVDQEKDYETLNNLLQELRQSYTDVMDSDSLLINSSKLREQLSDMVKAADEVTINLYTQRADFAFDLAFALDNVSKIYTTFQDQARLSDKYMLESRSGLRRYTMLEETLRDMYTEHPIDPLTDFYRESLALALQDSIYFADTERRLQQAYEYAQASYSDSQKNRFIGGNVNAAQIVKNWKTFIREIKEDLNKRYSMKPLTDNSAEDGLYSHTWSGTAILTYAVIALLMLALSFLAAGLISHFAYKRIRKQKLVEFRPILSAILGVFLFAVSMLLIRADRSNPYWRMAYLLLSQFSWLTLAILVSLLIRIQGDQAKASRNIYIPTLLMAFLCILMRAIFLPASVVPLVFPPFLLIFIIWQSLTNIRYRTQVNGADLRYMWVSVGIMSIVFILSLVGYSMIGVLIITFWTFMLALLHTITTLFYLMRQYYDKRVSISKAEYRAENPLLPLESNDAFIEVTWFYDLLRMVVVPITTLMTFPLGVLLTGRAYQLSHAGAELLRRPLFHREGFEFLTVHNILLVLALFFVFRYLIYLVKALYRLFRLRKVIGMRKEDSDIPLKESDANMSLSNTIISLAGWLFYLFIAFSILDISTSTLGYVTTGLAAGVGFALKDLINNFFYGIQLMAGRIRVGDTISCDGVRGIVKRVSYQTTQVQDEDGSLIAFTNTDLFTKKFRNLNTGRNYEIIKMPVSVAYGTDIAFARKVILDALKPLMTKDKSGRPVVDPSFPIDVRFDGYGDSSVNLVVALYTTVETHYTFPSRAKEAIYNAFYENGISIPFPQRDVYVKQVPKD